LSSTCDGAHRDGESVRAALNQYIDAVKALAWIE
jgi:hypothetical protein